MLREEVLKAWIKIKPKFPRNWQLSSIYQNWLGTNENIIPNKIITLEELVLDSKVRGQERKKLIDFHRSVVYKVLGAGNYWEVSDEQVFQALQALANKEGSSTTEKINKLEEHLYTLNNSTIEVLELVKIKVSPPDYYKNPLYCSEMKPMGDDIEISNIAQPRSICRVDLEYKVLKVLPLQVIRKTETSNVYQSNELRREERPQVPINSILPDWLSSGPIIEEVD